MQLSQICGRECGTADSPADTEGEPDMLQALSLPHAPMRWRSTLVRLIEPGRGAECDARNERTPEGSSSFPQASGEASPSVAPSSGAPGEQSRRNRSVAWSGPKPDRRRAAIG
jgi:hypothetical protein